MNHIYRMLCVVMMRLDDAGRIAVADWLRDGPLDYLWKRGAR